MCKDMEMILYLIFFVVIAAIMLINFNEDMNPNCDNDE